MTDRPQIRGTYSIYYYHGDRGDTYAVDWDYPLDEFRAIADVLKSLTIPPMWWASARDGVEWSSHREDREKMRKVLLEHFGLMPWEKEFPVERILFMSPRKLIAVRREKEDLDSTLSRHEAMSDTVGYHVSPEAHLDT